MERGDVLDFHAEGDGDMSGNSEIRSIYPAKSSLESMDMNMDMDMNMNMIMDAVCGCVNA